ncbi:outer membrane protein assembly factor BamB family protein [Sulfurirhabdus autotrophica]|uniref:Outer membrane protein assembly factor BamB n=1 Tax=Sulfurirhabdus autotrophica TaxID=1706046 RepID=A0A4R3YCC3_9PROT|nr:PQQ-binding-like beta-propeller repeat protein [Sulfurirhabdus autotrophica]TCV89630.1 outer membrane protein assembly factor BamB [Sulfurirhabdus autotrophica]
MNQLNFPRIALCFFLFTNISAIHLSANAQEFIQYGSPNTYNNTTARAAFPQSWSQYGNGQQHNPVYTVPGNAPSFLTTGISTISPLTGDEFRRIDLAQNYFPQDGRMAWGSSASQWVGNVAGSSVAQGIVFTTTSRREIYATDAQSGLAIWRKELVSVAGMGQPLVQTIGGKLRVIVTTGDADFNAQNSVRAIGGLQHDRGAEFSAVYCLDALTGTQIWRFDTQGSSRPTPLYRNGYLYVVSGDGHLYVLDATNGSLISTFTNPGEGQVGLSSPNWFLTAQGHVLIYYGTLSPRNIVAVDVTSPAAPVLAWTYAPPGAASNAPGDVSVAVDQSSALLVTSVFTNVGTTSSPIYDEQIIALDANTGQAIWNVYSGQGPTLDGFKSANPMINNGVVYLGNPLNATVQAYDLRTGSFRWSTAIPSNDPAIRNAPRAAPVLVNGKLIIPVAQHIYTFDAMSGALLNDYYSPQSYIAFGLNQPVVVGNVMYISSTSGYVYTFPVSYITTQAGPGPVTVPALPLKTAEYYDSTAKPSSSQKTGFPAQWLSYAGGQNHNSYLSTGPAISKKWASSMLSAISLSSTPLDDAIFGTEIATQMTHLSFGAGTGVAAANGIAYATGNNRTVNAYNATTGKLIWRFRTNNHNFGQPVVTPNAVLVMGGNIATSLSNNISFSKQSAQTRLGTGFMYIHALDPLNGNEKWTFYAGQGAMSSTPLYSNGVLYWVDGQSKVWAINADTGTPVAPFMDSNGNPLLTLGGGFNAVSSANVYQDPSGKKLMVVGMSMPNQMVAVDLGTATIAWTQPLTGLATHFTGLSSASPAIDQANGLVISTAMANVDSTTNTAQVLTFGLNASTGTIVWTQLLDAGPIPAGFVAPTPMVANNRVYLTNPTANQITALDATTGSTLWKTAVTATGGKYSWAPGTLVGSTKLIMPMGGNLYTLNPDSGALLKTYVIGGAHTYNHVLVIGNSVYLGNAYGWVLGIPLADVAG